MLSKPQKDLILFLESPKTVNDVCQKFGIADAFAFFDLIEQDQVKDFVRIPESGSFDQRLLSLTTLGQVALETLKTERRDFLFSKSLPLIISVFSLIISVLSFFISLRQ